MDEVHPILAAVGKAATLDPLAESKAIIRRFNYGEMKAYCEATGSDPDKVWEWATQ
jgi:hypothetical protein